MRFEPEEFVQPVSCAFDEQLHLVVCELRLLLACTSWELYPGGKVFDGPLRRASAMILLASLARIGSMAELRCRIPRDHRPDVWFGDNPSKSDAFVHQSRTKWARFYWECGFTSGFCSGDQI